MEMRDREIFGCVNTNYFTGFGYFRDHPKFMGYQGLGTGGLKVFLTVKKDEKTWGLVLF